MATVKGSAANKGKPEAGGSLVGLLIGWHVNFLTLVDGFHGGSLV